MFQGENWRNLYKQTPEVKHRHIEARMPPNIQVEFSIRTKDTFEKTV